MAPKPVGPYSQAVEINGALYLSGQIGIDPKSGKLVDGFESQVRQVFANLEAVLREGGYSKREVVKVVIYLTDLSRFSELNKVYEEFFREVEPKPARVTVGVNELPLGAQVEIELTAVKG